MNGCETRSQARQDKFHADVLKIMADERAASEARTKAAAEASEAGTKSAAEASEARMQAAAEASEARMQAAAERRDANLKEFYLKLSQIEAERHRETQEHVKLEANKTRDLIKRKAEEQVKLLQPRGRRREHRSPGLGP